MRQVFTVAVLALSLSGCITTPSMRAEAAAKADDEFCQQIGAAPKTPEYIACRVKRNEVSQANERARMSSGLHCTTYYGVTNCY